MRSLLLSLVPLLVAGCGSDAYQVAAVSGRITLNGQPLANAAVVFQPVRAGRGQDPGPGSTGVTSADGRYTLLMTGSEKKGAVVGKHKIRITMMQEIDSSDDRPKKLKVLPKRYNQETTLEFEVPANGSEAADFALTEP